jgi:hypothetical protein
VATWDWSAGTVTFQAIQGTSSPPAVNTTTTVDNTKINRIPGVRYDALLAILTVSPSQGAFTAGSIADCRVWGDYQSTAGNYPTLVDVPPGAVLKPRPYIDCYLRRSDGTNTINPSTGVNATYGTGYTDLKVYPISGAVAGTWDTAYSGRGLACTLPGWYAVYAVLGTAYAGDRWVQLELYGTENRIIGADTAPSGFGTAADTVPVRAPSGIQLLFEAFNSVNASIPLRLVGGGSGGTGGTPISMVRVVYLGSL